MLPFRPQSPGPPQSAPQPPSKLGAAQVFGRPSLPQRPTAPEAMGPDKDAQRKKTKLGAAAIFARRR